MKKIDLLKQLLSSEKKIFLSKDIYPLLEKIKHIRGFKSMSFSILMEFLEKQNFLVKEYFLHNDNTQGYVCTNGISQADIFDIAGSRYRSYFSFYTALYLNGLTLQIPKNIYLTVERLKTYPNTNTLIQENINKVFSGKPRVTTDTRKFNDYKVHYIDGQAHENLGLVTFRDELKKTNIERTLIDCTVRPFYCGGVTQVLEAYSNAKDILDIQKLYTYLQKMNFTYPYGQLIGFYLQHSGYSMADYSVFEKTITDFKFYTSYNIFKKAFDPKWQIYYPQGLI
ncbi:type IV toxin-antitoxin system AbiEi family antitoxin domain-containing protein [Capnocytophaga canis]|uniref:AbiEi antitoxin C-terminal domain-containing protein n=2 Tax=Capnocytophaga canis TaxID=1848903 RepID=A0A0B7IT54_9FLAO|nr:hypothetical protein [Capnocytophaga canis]CEN53779.1 conserved hypothetical protein [Capnocytophaga canis]